MTQRHGFLVIKRDRKKEDRMTTTPLWRAGLVSLGALSFAIALMEMVTK